jgi:hypothetical protein
MREYLKHTDNVDEVTARFAADYPPSLEGIIRREVAALNTEIREMDRQVGPASVLDQGRRNNDVTVGSIISLQDEFGDKYLTEESGDCNGNAPASCSVGSTDGCVTLSSKSNKFIIHQPANTHVRHAIEKLGVVALQSLPPPSSSNGTASFVQQQFGRFLGVCPDTGNLQWFQVDLGADGVPLHMQKSICWTINWQAETQDAGLTDLQMVELYSPETKGYLLNTYGVEHIGNDTIEEAAVVKEGFDVMLRSDLHNHARWQIACDDCASSTP